MTDKTLFPATMMPDKDWWLALWPDPKSVLQSVGIQSDMEVVDLCCGDGHFTKPLCQITESGKIWALDMDKELLEQAEQLCQKHENFQSILGDARELHKAIDHEVDFVFFANTFHGVPDKTALAKAVYEVLKPGGRFAIVNWYPKPREETIVLEQPRGPDTKLRMSPEEVQSFVEPTGLTLEIVVDVGPYHYASIFSKRAG